MTDEALELSKLLNAGVPAPPIPASESTFKNPLEAIKPYPHHAGCGGMVLAFMGLNEEEDPVIMFKCSKCGLEDIVEPVEVEDALTFDPPYWVLKPNV